MLNLTELLSMFIFMFTVTSNFGNVSTVLIYKTIILPVVLYGCETRSLTLREEHRLRVFENWVLTIFGPKRDEVTSNRGE
jgi:hypothetical protein